MVPSRNCSWYIDLQCKCAKGGPMNRLLNNLAGEQGKFESDIAQSSAHFANDGVLCFVLRTRAVLTPPFAHQTWPAMTLLAFFLTAAVLHSATAYSDCLDWARWMMNCVVSMNRFAQSLMQLSSRDERYRPGVPMHFSQHRSVMVATVCCICTQSISFTNPDTQRYQKG